MRKKINQKMSVTLAKRKVKRWNGSLENLLKFGEEQANSEIWKKICQKIESIPGLNAEEKENALEKVSKERAEFEHNPSRNCRGLSYVNKPFQNGINK